MNRPIFRQEALDRLSSPEQLDQLMQVTAPRAWIALGACALLILAALLWGFFGTIPTTVEGKGFLVPSQGIKTMTAPRGATVAKVLVHPGDEVETGQVLVTLTPHGGGAEVPVPSPSPARVLAAGLKAGDAVEQGAALVTLEPRDDTLVAVVYVPAADGYQVKEGMSAQVWPAFARKGEFGSLVGSVRSAGRFPVGQADMMRQLGSGELVSSLSGTGPLLEVVVELQPDPAAPGAYRWSSSRGAPVGLSAGTPCQGIITVRKQHPVRLVFPLPAVLSGT
ncbi:MAG TPA: HlyD family efflux transporter periplasmic adaptor subunit [Gemmataceae bacterium]|nr:HlyD family efflux transporter periplasmic adaptor subunit [Gemmataceae bacterium]